MKEEQILKEEQEIIFYRIYLLELLLPLQIIGLLTY